MKQQGYLRKKSLYTVSQKRMNFSQAFLPKWKRIQQKNINKLEEIQICQL